MEDRGKEIFPKGVGVRWKNGPGGGQRRKSAPSPTPTSPLHQSSTGQVSKMAASKRGMNFKTVVPRIDTPKYGETLKFVYIK